jgi:transposase
VADRLTLERWVRARTSPQSLVLRSRIVLMLADGRSGRAVAQMLEVSRHTVDLWRTRYQDGGCEALGREKPGRGRKRAGGPVISRDDISR